MRTKTTPTIWVARAFLLVLASVFIVALLVRSVGIDRWTENLRNADARLLIAAAGLYIAELGVRMVRWRLLFRATGLGPALAIWSVGTGVNELLPSGAGEIARGLVAAKRFRITVASVLAPTAVERLMDLAVLLGLAAITVLVLVVPVSPVAVVVPLAIVLTGAAVLLRPAVLSVPASWLARRPGLPTRVATFLRRLQINLVVVAHRRWALALTVCLTAGVWVLEGLVQWLVLRAIGGDVPLVTVISFTALAYLFGFVSFLPGGLGSREAALAGLFQTAGVAGHIATTATISLRACQTLLVLLVGAGAALFAFGRMPGGPIDVGTSSQPAIGPEPPTASAEVSPVFAQD